MIIVIFVCNILSHCVDSPESPPLYFEIGSMELWGVEGSKQFKPRLRIHVVRTVHSQEIIAFFLIPAPISRKT